MGRLEKKVAIVTGAGAPLGLGRSYALALAKEGCSVIVNDINESADKVAKEITEAGGKAVPVIARIGTKAAGEKLVEAAVREFCRVDILVNNAGNIYHAKLTELDEKQWDDLFTVHVKGAVFCASAAAKWMIDNEVKGRIIYITSTAGMYGAPEGSGYCAAKAAMIGLTKANSLELARYGICVNAVAPGALTMDFESMPPLMKEVAEKMVAGNVVQRIGRPDDVAPVIVFLASEDSHYVTGQVIAATGNTGVV